MKLSKILEIPSMRILLYVHEKGGEVRYTDLAELIGSRGTLAKSLEDIMDEKFLERRIVRGKPIRSYYYLTKKGKEAAEYLTKIRAITSH